MSREEIINTKAYQTTKAATIYYNQHHNDSDIDLMDAFEAGAEYADKITLEKVLNFIYENFYDHPHASGHICTDSFQSLEKLEEELIKTIES